MYSYMGAAHASGKCSLGDHVPDRVRDELVSFRADNLFGYLCEVSGVPLSPFSGPKSGSLPVIASAPQSHPPQGNRLLIDNFGYAPFPPPDASIVSIQEGKAAELLKILSFACSPEGEAEACLRLVSL